MRRIYTYTDGQGFNFWNMVATIGAFTIAVSILSSWSTSSLSYRRHRANPVNPGPDPWDARRLEWMIPSPAPEHNFDEVPVVEEFDEFWHRKYGHDENGRLVRIAKTEDVVQKGDATGVHLPSPSLLADRAGGRSPAHRLRRHLPTCGGPCPASCSSSPASTAGSWSRRSDPDAGHDHDDHPTSDDDSDAAETPELTEPSTRRDDDGRRRRTCASDRGSDRRARAGERRIDRGGPRWLKPPRGSTICALDPVDDVDSPTTSTPPPPASPTRSWAMWVFLASDCLLFGGLISTYLLYKNRPGAIEGLVGAPSRRSSESLRHPVHVDDRRSSC